MRSSHFLKEFAALINKHSLENLSNTPDFIIAEFLTHCHSALITATKARDKWYGVDLSPSELITSGDLTIQEYLKGQIAMKKRRQESLTSHQLQVEDCGQLAIEIRTLEGVLNALPKEAKR